MRLPKNGKVKPLSQMSTFLQTLINSMLMQFTDLVIRENSNPYFHLTLTSTWTSTDWNFSSLWIWPLIKAPFRPFGKKLLTKMPKNVIHRNNWIKCTHLISTILTKVGLVNCIQLHLRHNQILCQGLLLLIAASK